MEWSDKDERDFMRREVWILILNILHVIVRLLELGFCIAIPVLILVAIFF